MNLSIDKDMKHVLIIGFGILGAVAFCLVGQGELAGTCLGISITYAVKNGVAAAKDNDIIIEED
jgi:hypothetical protein